MFLGCITSRTTQKITTFNKTISYETSYESKNYSQTLPTSAIPSAYRQVHLAPRNKTITTDYKRIVYRPPEIIYSKIPYTRSKTSSQNLKLKPVSNSDKFLRQVSPVEDELTSNSDSLTLVSEGSRLTRNLSLRNQDVLKYRTRLKKSENKIYEFSLDENTKNSIESLKRSMSLEQNQVKSKTLGHQPSPKASQKVPHSSHTLNQPLSKNVSSPSLLNQPPLTRASSLNTDKNLTINTNIILKQKSYKSDIKLFSDHFTETLNNFQNKLKNSSHHHSHSSHLSLKNKLKIKNKSKDILNNSLLKIDNSRSDTFYTLEAQNSQNSLPKHSNIKLHNNSQHIIKRSKSQEPSKSPKTYETTLNFNPFKRNRNSFREKSYSTNTKNHENTSKNSKNSPSVSLDRSQSVKETGSKNLNSENSLKDITKNFDHENQLENSDQKLIPSLKSDLSKSENSIGKSNLLTKESLKLKNPEKSEKPDIKSEKSSKITCVKSCKNTKNPNYENMSNTNFIAQMHENTSSKSSNSNHETECVLKKSTIISPSYQPTPVLTIPPTPTKIHWR